MADATEYLGRTRRDQHRALCRILCHFVGIEPIDSTDNSDNWWMFAEDVEALMANLEMRGFKFGTNE